MFTDDIETDTIDGTKYYTFQPNTIVYAVPVNSDLGKQMNRAKMGIVATQHIQVKNYKI